MSESPLNTLVVTVAMATDTGRKRKQNQDAIGHLIPDDPALLAESGQLFVLADGVGGLRGGDLASQYAVSTILSSYYEQTEGEPPERLARAVAEANNVVYAEGHGTETPGIMATTVVAAVVRGRELIIGSVGDSPAFLMRDARARKLTVDHTVDGLREENGVEPLPDGDATGAKLVRALGSMPSVKVDIISGQIRDGDHVVLCSDGLTRHVSPETIETTVATGPLEDAVQALIDLANDSGGSDNISVIALRVHDTRADDGDRVVSDHDTAAAPADTHRVRSAAATTAASRSPRDATPRETARERIARRRSRTAASLTGEIADFMRNNMIVTAITMGVVLVLFVIFMLVVSNAGDENEEDAIPPTTAVPSADLTATAALAATGTAQFAAVQTEDAIQAATAAQIARLTLTPPTPIPTSGPQLENGMWFKVLPGEAIATFSDIGLDSEPSEPLEADNNYRVSQVELGPEAGPWYWVIDNLGVQARWINGPSLHNRIVVVDTSGQPLPDSEQPRDIPPPSEARRTPTATPTPRAPSTVSGLTGTPGTPTVPAATVTPTIAYGVETWGPGSFVSMKDGLDLCARPSIPDCGDVSTADAGETARVIDGPVDADGHWWWEVQFDDGRSGWIAQVLLDTP